MPPCSGTHDSSTRSSTSTSSRYPLLRDGHATGQRSLDEPIKYRDSKPIGKRAHAHLGRNLYGIGSVHVSHDHRRGGFGDIDHLGPQTPPPPAGPLPPHA